MNTIEDDNRANGRVLNWYQVPCSYTAPGYLCSALHNCWHVLRFCIRIFSRCFLNGYLCLLPLQIVNPLDCCSSNSEDSDKIIIICCKDNSWASRPELSFGLMSLHTAFLPWIGPILDSKSKMILCSGDHVSCHAFDYKLGIVLMSTHHNSRFVHPCLCSLGSRQLNHYGSCLVQILKECIVARAIFCAAGSLFSCPLVFAGTFPIFNFYVPMKVGTGEVEQI